MDTLDMFLCKSFKFTDNDTLLCRTGTNGFQPKFITPDKSWFVKMQATISGVLRNDWICEIIASDFMQQLGIKGVVQRECDITYNQSGYKGVYSSNFEQIGDSFISFENRMSKNNVKIESEDYFRLDNLNKLKYLSNYAMQTTGISQDDYFDYLLDLCVIDILVGNNDRLPHNYGFCLNDCNYKVPLIFDCGMSLFEHDYDLDNVKTFDEAMRNVYVGPVFEDPFDLLHELQDSGYLDKYEFTRLKYPSRLPNRWAKEYLDRIFKELV